MRDQLILPIDEEAKNFLITTKPIRNEEDKPPTDTHDASTIIPLSLERVDGCDLGTPWSTSI